MRGGCVQSIINTCARLGFAILALSLSLIVAVAEASPITYTFSGTITEANVILTGTQTVTLGQTVMASVPYHSTIGTTGVNMILRMQEPFPVETLTLRAPMTGDMVHITALMRIGERFLFPLPLEITAQYPYDEALALGGPGPLSLGGFLDAPTFRFLLDSDKGDLGTVSTLTAVLLPPAVILFGVAVPFPLPPVMILFGAGLVALIGLSCLLGCRWVAGCDYRLSRSQWRAQTPGEVFPAS